MRKIRQSTIATILAWVTVLLSVGPSVKGADLIDAVEKGNEAFQKEDYKTALEQYQIAEAERPESPELDYNIGGVLHQEGKFEGAVDRYVKSLDGDDVGLTAQAQYNLGNTYYRMGDYQGAITAYEDALKLNPEDMDAKFNLELARKMLKENMDSQQQDQQQQQQEQQQQEEEKKKEEEQQQEEQEPDQQPEGENEEDQQQQQQQQQQQGDQSEEQDQQQKQQQSQSQRISKEDAERILNGLKDDEQDVQKKVRRHNVPTNYTGKDW